MQSLITHDEHDVARLLGPSAGSVADVLKEVLDSADRNGVRVVMLGDIMDRGDVDQLAVTGINLTEGKFLFIGDVHAMSPLSERVQLADLIERLDVAREGGADDALRTLVDFDAMEPLSLTDFGTRRRGMNVFELKPMSLGLFDEPVLVPDSCEERGSSGHHHLIEREERRKRGKGTRRR